MVCKTTGGYNMKKKKKGTIGQMSNSRLQWSINPTTRIKQSKKGKGSYSRQKAKQLSM